MVMVTKRDGRKESFIPEKVVVSALKAGATPDYARTIAQDVGRNAKEGISTQEIRIKVLSQLRAKDPAWEKNWLMYDAAVKKRPA
ncbi:MAG: ATPase [Methanomicrobiales archaeon]|nr:ATPase [Methanomicrobiales archaeon]MDD1654342.1 ATPase [Methanomicrobiales archaeon]